MKSTLAAVGALVVGVLSACDVPLVDPAAPAHEVQLSLVPLAASHDTTYGDLIPGLAPVRHVQFSFLHDGIARDTIVSAVRQGTTLQTRVLLRPDEVLGWLEVRAELRIEGGAPVFSGHALIHTLAMTPRATLELVPIASQIGGANIPPFDALGDTTTPNALAMFATGFAIEGARMDWSSGAPAIVEIIGGNRLVSRGNGSAIVTASSLGAVRNYAVVVRQVPITLTGIGPADTTVSLGSTFQARPFGQDSNGYPLLPGAGVSWSASGSVSIDSLGIVTATGLGAGSIGVEVSATSHYAAITIVP